MTRIEVYSAIKIMANFPPLYSVLNPDTSSDSPSAKSNGARFVSAKVVVNHDRKTGKIATIRGAEEQRRILMNLNLFISKIALIKTKAIEISYEIVWAMPRSAPRRAYFLFEDHPAASVVYTESPEMARNKIIDI